MSTLGRLKWTQLSKRLSVALRLAHVQGAKSSQCNWTVSVGNDLEGMSFKIVQRQFYYCLRYICWKVLFLDSQRSALCFTHWIETSIEKLCSETPQNVPKHPLKLDSFKWLYIYIQQCEMSPQYEMPPKVKMYGFMRLSSLFLTFGAFQILGGHLRSTGPAVYMPPHGISLAVLTYLSGCVCLSIWLFGL